MLKGIPASQGIAVGKVRKIEPPVLRIIRTTADPDTELQRFRKASGETVNDIEKIRRLASDRLSPKELAIFEMHLLLIRDASFVNGVEDIIRNEHINAEAAVQEVSGRMIHEFETMDDTYFQERAADVKDVTFRLLCHLADRALPDVKLIDEPVIIVAKDLSPSDTGSLDRRFVLGFATELGGRTSHTAIMARSMEIPALVGVKDLMNTVKDGDQVILDAVTGTLIADPSAEQSAAYSVYADAWRGERESLKVLKQEESVTRDGHHVEICGNIGSPDDTGSIIANGADGIGLFRSEFLYMRNETGFPDENTQYEAYRSVLERMGDRRVVIRTLDIGGDKQLAYHSFEREMNPFLGARAMRFCLAHEDVLRTQFRALIRASAHGKLAVLFPMIATTTEFRRAKEIWLEEREKLKQAEIPMADSTEIGVMIEIPAAAVIADQLAEEADFFSIGTNDLIQYVMAADRTNDKVAYLYEPFNPAVLRMIRMTIEGAHKHGRRCAMCGEMASDELAIPVLLGLGLDEFSMSAGSVLQARKQIRSLDYSETVPLARKVMELSSQEEVIACIKEYMLK
ncbi:MAG: phosphoenolpyruvate--protein phosphotransferase [Solobacterium sp.]|nr:phosphoenolpyruvate--protein phosphotransferase [Solobacterium sp.]